MRLAELTAKREDARDSKDLTIHWFQLKNLEKLKEKGDDFVLKVDEILYQRKKVTMATKLQNVIKAVYKVSKNNKKID